MISYSQLSKRMKIGRRRIEQLIQKCQAYTPIDKIRPKRGMIDEIEFFLAYIKYIEDKHLNAKSRGEDLLKAQTRLRLAQAQRAELEIEKENKLLVPKQISINFISNIFGNIRNKLLGARYRIAFDIFGSKNLKEAKLKSDKLVNEILNELSDPKTLYKKG